MSDLTGRARQLESYSNSLSLHEMMSSEQPSAEIHSNGILLYVPDKKSMDQETRRCVTV